MSTTLFYVQQKYMYDNNGHKVDKDKVVQMAKTPDARSIIGEERDGIRYRITTGTEQKRERDAGTERARLCCFRNKKTTKKLSKCLKILAFF